MAHGGIFRCMVVAALMAAVIVTSDVAAATEGTSVSAHAASKAVELGESVSITGTVTPPTATTRVVVQRSLGRGKWSDRASAQVRTDGTFSASVRPSGAGLYALRVRTGDGSAVSMTLFLKVRLGPNQAIRGFDFPRIVRTLSPEDGVACGDGGQATARPVDRKKVWFGNLTGTPAEEASVVVDCVDSATASRWSVVLLFGLSGDTRPQVLGPPFRVPVPVASAPEKTPSLFPMIASAAISTRAVHVEGAYRPSPGCRGCVQRKFRWVLRINNGRIEGTQLCPTAHCPVG